MAAPRIAIVGGGSFQWGPFFTRDILTTSELAGATICLHDIDPAPLEKVARLGRMLAERHDCEHRIETTLDLDEALTGADFVVLTITTGGLETMRVDLEVPAKYGVHQSVGDTVGPGGLSRGLRNVPVVVELAQRMEALCPNAWLLNYTNPMTTLTRAVTRETRIKTVGLCHELVGVLRGLERELSVPREAIRVRAGGINHLLWVLDMWADDRDLMPAVADHAKRCFSRRSEVQGLPDAERHGTMDHWLIKARLLDLYGALPAAGDRHLAEFFSHFLTEATGQGRRWGVELTTVEERAGWRRGFEGFVDGLLGGRLDTARFMSSVSDEAAGPIISRLATGRPYTGIVNLPNAGQIANLPPDVVVETMGVLEPSGARGISVGALPREIQSIVAGHVANQEAIVDAALCGDRRLALAALAADPLIASLDDAERMLDEMLEANRRWLPRFF